MRGYEIDFVVKNKRGEIEYYQVAWEISNSSTADREFKSLEAIKDNFPKYLLTTESFPQSRNGIKHINVFEWLLQR
jgi:predicted AAA+ superfamily ATPase